MGKIIYSVEDRIWIRKKGITEEKILKQIETFKRGIPYMKLDRPCKVGDGIVTISENWIPALTDRHKKASVEGRILKFVPASGAASRMFRPLSALLKRSKALSYSELRRLADKDDKNAKFGLKFFDNLNKFAFYERLKTELLKRKIDIEKVSEITDLRIVLSTLLSEDGLRYSKLPKAVIEFHDYPDGPRTASEEHIAEGKEYAADSFNNIYIHFTVIKEQLEYFDNLIDSLKDKYFSQGYNFEFEFSFQKHSTDTIAVNMNNEPFYDEEGKLLFRPSGHGALLENLNDLDGDIVFIKNIDNVVPDRLKDQTILYKKVLCGYLIELEEQIFNCLRLLETGRISEDKLDEIKDFAAMRLYIPFPDTWIGMSIQKKSDYLFRRLNRPIRVCGMVKNVGAAGGGPFWVRKKNGELSIQIVETSQIDLNSREQKEIFESSTHFNPVDIVCGLKDYNGDAFNLINYVDHEAGFIAVKSSDGIELKAL